VNLYELTINEAHQLLKNKDISSRELTHAVLDRIDAVENKIDAFITVSEELALQQADQADAMIARGDSTPLTGIPLGIKDLMCTRNLATSCGSKILKGFLPHFYATFILK
jgi:aspartyl-tRNA(Asn)/glutamyl-tRNA(Gln) amidotransferase subunit A